MPFRLDEFTTKVQFQTFAEMPYLITQAAQAVGLRSNTEYIQRAVCEALARDLGLDLEELLSRLPVSRGKAAGFLAKHQ
jgi:hypothetical protein